MPWWGWFLAIGGVVVSLGLVCVVALAALFAKGDNPEGKWLP